MTKTTQRTAPTCSDCGAVSVLDPCRDCMTPEELAALPLAPWEANE